MRCPAATGEGGDQGNLLAVAFGVGTAFLAGVEIEGLAQPCLALPVGRGVGRPAAQA